MGRAARQGPAAWAEADGGRVMSPRVLWVKGMQRHLHGKTPIPELLEQMERQRVVAPPLGLGSAIDMLIVSQTRRGRC